jgi:hypothetical protein
MFLIKYCVFDLCILILHQLYHDPYFRKNTSIQLHINLMFIGSIRTRIIFVRFNNIQGDLLEYEDMKTLWTGEKLWLRPERTWRTRQRLWVSVLLHVWGGFACGHFCYSLRINVFKPKGHIRVVGNPVSNCGILAFRYRLKRLISPPHTDGFRGFSAVPVSNHLPL